MGAAMESGLNAKAMAAAAAVDETRLWQALMDLAAVGARADGGVCRHALSDEDIAARALVIGWAQGRGYEASVDDAANLFIRRRGRDNDAAPVLAGSHMDSQPAGGKFDGAYGVLAGLEVLMALDDAGIKTERPIDIVAWTNEEGGRFDRSCTGSSIWSGVSELESYLGDFGADGVPLGEALTRTLAATPDLARRPRHWTPHAFIEPHIEQGPVLEAQGLPVAVVTGIQGVRWMNVEVSGEAGHAGTTPMTGRRDAVQGSLRAVAALNTLMADAEDRVRFTVGRVNVTPNSPNTIPEKVLFSIDFRHPDRDLLEDRGGRIAEVVRRAAQPCETLLVPTLTMDPTPFPETMIGLIEASAQALDLGCTRLASGAFHDALYAARVCPTSMIFIPCRGGLSHHPAEWAEPRHCADGARVLAAALVELANS
jgi:beta-ureidopropionase / N-carbamoyl-L-amino-acid hydrolase